MSREEKEKIIQTIRKKHGIAIDINDPLFAIVTANEIMLERQLKQQNKHFTEQLIEIEIVTNKYLTQSKELIEKKLTLALKEANEKLQVNNQQKKKEIKEDKANSIMKPILFIITGIIIGYTIALLIL